MSPNLATRLNLTFDINVCATDDQGTWEYVIGDETETLHCAEGGIIQAIAQDLPEWIDPRDFSDVGAIVLHKDGLAREIYPA